MHIERNERSNCEKSNLSMNKFQDFSCKKKTKIITDTWETKQCSCINGVLNNKSDHSQQHLTELNEALPEQGL